MSSEGRLLQSEDHSNVGRARDLKPPAIKVALLCCGFLVLTSWYIWPIPPRIMLAEELHTRWTDREGTRHKGMPAARCLIVYVSDAYCSACRAAAAQWKPLEGFPEMWLMINNAKDSNAFLQFFSNSPSMYGRIHSRHRIPAENLASMGLRGTPTTLVLDSMHRVIEMRLGFHQAIAQGHSVCAGLDPSG